MWASIVKVSNENIFLMMCNNAFRGIRRLNAQLLVLADAYFGVFTVDIEKGISTKVFDSKTLIDGHQAMFLNDLDVLDENTV